MDEIIADLGYQKNLEDIIRDKMMMYSLIFQDQVYMAMVFKEILANELKNTDNKAEVEYEHSTSTIFVKGDLTICDVQVAMCAALAIAIRTGSNATGIFLDVLTHQMISTTGLDSCTCINHFLDYVKNPAKLQSFFKVFNIAPNEYQILLN